jgi:chromosome segregation ATPase
MKSEFLDTIDRISRARHNEDANPSLPGEMANDAPDFEPAMEESMSGLPNELRILDDTTVDRLVRVLEHYRGHVDAWSAEEPELKWSDKLPSGMTMMLLALGVGLVVGLNAFVLNRESTNQQVAISNLGGAVVLMLAGISLFYDRTVRGIGNDRLRQECGRRVELISDQISSLSALYSRWLIEWRQQEGNLRLLKDEVVRQEIVGQEAKAESKRLADESQEWLSKRISYEEQADSQDQRLQQLRSEVEFASRKLAGLEQENRTKGEQANGLRVQRDQLRQECLQLEQRKEELVETELRLQSEHVGNERVRQREMAALDRELGERRELVSGLRKEFESLGSERSELSLEIEMLRAEFERNATISTQELAELRDALHETQAERSLVEEAIERQKQVMEELELNRTELEALVAEIEAAKEGEYAELATVEANVVEQRQNVAALERDIEALEADRELRCAELQQRIETLESHLAERTTQLGGLRSEIERMEGNRKELQYDIERLTAIESAMDFSVEGLTERLEQRSSELRKKTMQVNELAARLESLSNTVKALTVQEGRMRGPQQLAEIEAGPVEVSVPSPATRERIADEVSIDGPSRVEGPHFQKADLHRMMQTLDQLDDLTQLGLS